MAATYLDPFGPGSPAYSLGGNVAQSNLQNLGLDQSIGSQINTFNEQQQQNINNARLGPQGVATQGQLLTNAQREAQGLLDPATEAMLQQSIAESGIGEGMGVDSQNLASAYRRALGLDISATEALGQQNYLGLLAANPSAPLFDISSLLVNPSTYAQVAGNTPTTDPTAGAVIPSGIPGVNSGTPNTGPNGPFGASGPRQGANQVVPTPAQGGALGGGGTYTTTTPAQPAPATTDPNADPFTSAGVDPFTGQPIPDNYAFGASNADITGFNYADLYDPAYGLLGPSSSLPDYSQVGPDPMALALQPTADPNAGMTDQQWQDYVDTGGFVP